MEIDDELKNELRNACENFIKSLGYGEVELTRNRLLEIISKAYSKKTAGKYLSSNFRP